jgi:hypothetical protein
MTNQEASAEIASKIAQIQLLLNECEALADEHSMSFSFDVAGYGMGGSYSGEANRQPDEYGDEATGWNASSQNC